MSEWSTASRYRMEARLRDSTYVCTLPFKNLQGEWYVGNKADNIRFELPLHHEKVTPDNIKAGLTEIWLWRTNDSDEDVLIFVGPLWDITIGSGERKLSCTAEGLESYFELMRVDYDYTWTATQLGTILWYMISTFQSVPYGNYGITQGTLEASAAIDFKVLRAEGKYIMDIATEFSTYDLGIDWKILPVNRAFSIWSPRRTAISPTRLEYGGLIQQYSVQNLGKWLRNDILVRGSNGNLGLATHEGSKAEFGRRDFVDDYNDATTTNALEARAGYDRDMRSTPRTVPQIVARGGVNPFEPASNINLGDQLHITIQDSIVNYDQLMRLTGFQLTVTKQERESINLYLNDLREVSS